MLVRVAAVFAFHGCFVCGAGCMVFQACCIASIRSEMMVCMRPVFKAAGSRVPDFPHALAPRP